MLTWLKSIDWGAIVGAALLTIFLMGIFQPSQGPGEHQEARKGDNGTVRINTDAVTAISTAVIAIFTIVLAVATDRQARLTRAALELGNREFVATHRPKIIVRSFQIGDRDMPTGKPIGFFFIAQNVGDSAASIIEVRSGTLIQTKRPRIPTDISFPFSEEFAVELASGGRSLPPPSGPKYMTVGCVIFTVPRRSSASHAVVPDTARARTDTARLRIVITLMASPLAHRRGDHRRDGSAEGTGRVPKPIVQHRTRCYRRFHVVRCGEPT